MKRENQLDEPIGNSGTFDWPDTVELSILSIGCIRQKRVKLDVGPYVFKNGKTDSELVYYFTYDELTEEGVEGMCFVHGELIVGIRRITSLFDRMFLVDRMGCFGERERNLGFPFAEELRYSVGELFLDHFAGAMKKLELLNSDNERVKNYRVLLSSDFSDVGLAFLRKHYHPLCLKVLKACSEKPKSDWLNTITKLTDEKVSIFQSEN